jgi:tRNA(Ile)-lysidine synthase
LKYKKKYRIEIGAMHVNHMIRGKEAEKDEKFCRQLCSKFAIEYHTAKRNVPAYSKLKKISIEEAAREVRYAELNKILQKYGYNKIATGHNSNDNSETMLLNLIKGSGLTGLSGIPIKRKNIIRPILSVERDEILSYLKKNKIKYLIDKSNLSDEYERNFIRNKLFPLIKKRLNSNLNSSLFRSSLVLKNQAQALRSAVGIISKSVTIMKDDTLIFPVDRFNELNKSLWGDVIKASMDNFFSIRAASATCNKVISLFPNQIGKKVNLSNGLTALRDRDGILIHRPKKEKKSKTVKIDIGSVGQIGTRRVSISLVSKIPKVYPNNKNIEYISGDNVHGNFTLRFWNNSDRFYPLGLNGSKKVSDFLNDKKIRSIEKRDQLVLLNENKIVWVVAQRIDERFKITAETRKVLQLCLS